mmetsp:Transcript_4429/g.12480  ORF Transcript_4429/g.12480 Transcript_4429/m.12480 type:complete len:226 (-) Transcript_4429:525-1202(-)
MVGLPPSRCCNLRLCLHLLLELFEHLPALFPKILLGRFDSGSVLHLLETRLHLCDLRLMLGKNRARGDNDLFILRMFVSGLAVLLSEGWALFDLLDILFDLGKSYFGGFQALPCIFAVDRRFFVSSFVIHHLLAIFFLLLCLCFGSHLVFSRSSLSTCRALFCVLGPLSANFRFCLCGSGNCLSRFRLISAVVQKLAHSCNPLLCRLSVLMIYPSLRCCPFRGSS